MRTALARHVALSAAAFLLVLASTSSVSAQYFGQNNHASQRIAIATVAGGRPALTIFDAQSGRKDREVPIPDVDDIINPTWAPDGHAVCFTGMKAGLTDLYLYDLNASRLRQLTDDPYADLQPA